MQRRSLLRSLPPLALLSGSGVLLAACGGGGGSAEPPAPAPAPAPPPVQMVRTYAYVANHDSRDISIYRIGSSGALERAGQVILSAPAESVSVHPSGRLAYVADSEGISIFGMDPETGMLTFRARGAIVDFPGEMRFHPSGRFAYVGEYGTDSVLCFAIEGGTGALSACAPPLEFAAPLGDIALSPDGSTLYVSASASNTVTWYALDIHTGAPGPGTSVGTQQDPQRISMAPSGNALYVAGADTITMHDIDPVSGLSAPIAVADAPQVGAMRIDPKGRFVCALTVDSGVSNAVSFYVIDPTTDELGEPITVRISIGYGLAVSHAGAAYITEANSNEVLAFQFDRDSRAVTSFGPFAAGEEPIPISVVTVVN